MNLLDNLNPQQQSAVCNTEGPLLIFAGAGSGKTRVITHRIAYLIREKGVPPYAIMAVTFTNKAAEEMKKRVAGLIGPIGESVFIKTFHSAAVFILRRYGEMIGIPRTFSIYDTRDQEVLIKEILLEMRLDPKKIRPAAIASQISGIKDRAEILEGVDLMKLMPKGYSFNFSELYDKYQERLNAVNALDFNDLLIKTVVLMRDRPDARAKLQQRWRYFMIDEYQDTNFAQYLICKYLSSASRNICVVGDDDQSIYSWRGADIRNILNFERDFEETAVVTLSENYRSSVQILDAASSVIRNNKNRKDKKLHAWRGDGEPVAWCLANNEYGEADYVISKIQSLKSMEKLENGDFAIFYRTNAQSRVFEEVLTRENIPYRVVGGLKFYDRKEVKDILAYLRFITNPLDVVSLLRIINTPARGIGAATIEKLRDTAYAQGVTEWDVILGKHPIKGKAPAGIANFRDIVSAGMEMAAGIPASSKLSSLVKHIIDISGYKKNLEDEDSDESKSRLENIDELLNSVFEYEARNPEATLYQFLQDISLLTSEDSPENVAGAAATAVSLMTVHNAKGLEFPVVFLTGMEEGIFPHINSSDTDEAIEEERRLCYVGITRAMDRVFITSAEIRRSYSGIDYKSPSRFIMEIPEGSLSISEYSESGFSSPASGNKWNARPYGVAQRTPHKTPAVQTSSSGFKIRETVIHPRFGRGKVISIEGAGDNTKITIVFSNGDRKTFLEKYTPLEKALR